MVLDRGFKTQGITDAQVYMLAEDNMPLSTTEKPGFISFMHKAVYMCTYVQNSFWKKIRNLDISKYEVLSSLIKPKLLL